VELCGSGVHRHRHDALDTRTRRKRFWRRSASAPGQADEIAVVAFLASPAAGYITGSIVHVNGGMHMS